jgi:hypothetical protein
LATLALPFQSIVVWALTSAAVAVGAAFGYLVVASTDREASFADALTRIDGRNYRHIIEDGYSYQVDKPSLIAFFPSYPLAVRSLARITRASTSMAQLGVANACGLGAFLVMGTYLRERSRASLSLSPSRVGEAHVTEDQAVAVYPILAMAVFPTTFFFRMGYSESTFLFLAILSLWLIVRAAPLTVVALVVGLATATRPVGVALLLPLAWYACASATSGRSAVLRLAYALPLGCWGMLGFMFFQYLEFGQPFAFALTQTYHRMRPMSTAGDKWLALFSWEPIRDTYNPASPGYWQTLYYYPTRLFSLEFANPIYFVGAAALVALGARKQWLTRYELLLAVPLLAIPYFTRAYEMRMLSQARFAAVVFPVYIVVGHLLARVPPAVAGALLALSGLMMGLYAALFAAGYPFL